MYVSETYDKYLMDRIYDSLKEHEGDFPTINAYTTHLMKKYDALCWGYEAIDRLTGSIKPMPEASERTLQTFLKWESDEVARLRTSAKTWPFLDVLSALASGMHKEYLHPVLFDPFDTTTIDDADFKRHFNEFISFDKYILTPASNKREIPKAVLKFKHPSGHLTVNGTLWIERKGQNQAQLAWDQSIEPHALTHEQWDFVGKILLVEKFPYGMKESPEYALSCILREYSSKIPGALNICFQDISDLSRSEVEIIGPFATEQPLKYALSDGI